MKKSLIFLLLIISAQSWAYPEIFSRIKVGDYGNLSRGICGLHIEKHDGMLVLTFIANPVARPRGECEIQGLTVYSSYCTDPYGRTSFCLEANKSTIRLDVLDDGNFTYQIYNYRDDHWNTPVKFVKY